MTARAGDAARVGSAGRAVRRIVFASRNPAKAAELARRLTGVAHVEHLPDDMSLEDEELEDGPSLAAIARAKAARWSKALPGQVVVATDGGLLVPALGPGWDPLRTRRFAGARASDQERADALLALAADLEGDERQIGWREALAVARDGEVLAAWEVEGAPGLLARDYDAAHLAAGAGFWVPAVWICPEYGGRRLAELSETERAARDDHWARLGRALRRYLSELPPV